MGVKFRETSGFLNKTKKIYLANIAEIEVWKRHPEIFVRQNSAGWEIAVIAGVLQAVFKAVKENKYSKMYRQLMKIPALIRYSVSPKSSPLYIRDMDIDRVGLQDE